jgi:zinc transporter, ZIP family
MEVWFALGITLLAGLATGIGSIIAFTAKRTNYRFLSIATGFSAGVMLYVSFVEIFFKGLTALTERYGDYWGHWINAGSFFGGMLIIGLIDNLIPAGGTRTKYAPKPKPCRCMILRRRWHRRPRSARHCI